MKAIPIHILKYENYAHSNTLYFSVICDPFIYKTKIQNKHT